MTTTAPVIALDTHAALDASRVGRKAADLAAARAAGLPVVPGVVLTADWATSDHATAVQVWRIMSLDGARPLVVRTSAARSGRPRGAATDRRALEVATVVHDVDGLLAALAARRADDPGAPVLVQAHVEGAWRGELFADDGAHGWRSRPLVVAAAAATPHDEWIAELDHAGRTGDVLSGGPARGPEARLLARVQHLARKVADVLGGPHDVEWVAAADGRVQLLRARPVLRLTLTPCDGADARHEVAATRELVGSAA